MPREEATAALKIILSSLGKEIILDAINDLSPKSPTTQALGPLSSSSPVAMHYAESPRLAMPGSNGSTPAGVIGLLSALITLETKNSAIGQRPIPLTPPAMEWNRAGSPLTNPAESVPGTPICRSRPPSIPLDNMASLVSSRRYT